jgi:hypothetical protein
MAGSNPGHFSIRHCEFDTGLWPTLMDETNTAVIARLDRATQYSRDGWDKREAAAYWIARS